MKKTALLALLLVMGCVVSSQAVVIHWAADTANDGYTYTSAKLVYVSDGLIPNTPALVAGADVIGTASGNSLIAGTGQTDGVLERMSTDEETRSGDGKYYVVLFNSLGSAIAVSSIGLDWDDDNAITGSILDPASGVYNPDTWTPVPEPSTFALLAVGAAAIAWRRRKRS